MVPKNRGFRGEAGDQSLCGERAENLAAVDWRDRVDPTFLAPDNGCADDDHVPSLNEGELTTALADLLLAVVPDLEFS